MLAYNNDNCCNKLIIRQENAVEHVKLVKFNHSPYEMKLLLMPINRVRAQ